MACSDKLNSTRLTPAAQDPNGPRRPGDAVDAGPLAENRRTQRDTPVYVTPYGPYGVVPGTPASAQVVREALAAA